LAGLIAAGVGLIIGGYLTFFWSDVSAKRTVHRLHSASTDEERTTQARRLVALGNAGTPYLIEEWKVGAPASCQALGLAVAEHLAPMPPTDARFNALCRSIMAAAAQFSPAGQEAALELVPVFLTCPQADFLPRCRELVKAGLTLPTTEARVRAVRLAMRPDMEMRGEIVSVLGDPEAEVRRAAMLAVGPHDDQTPVVIADDELFRYLHDPDWDVRQMCETALTTRGLEPEQIACARLLTHPDASERLRLLVTLMHSRQTIRDPGPWLERLSRDSEPAVRAGAARVACDCRLAFTTWVDRLAKTDPDATVRQIAGFHRNRASDIREASFQER